MKTLALLATMPFGCRCLFEIDGAVLLLVTFGRASPACAQDPYRYEIWLSL